MCPLCPLVKTALARGAHEHVKTRPLYNPEKPGIEQVRWQWCGLCCGWAWFKDLTGALDAPPKSAVKQEQLGARDAA